MAETSGVTRVFSRKMRFVFLASSLLGVGLVTMLAATGSAFASKPASHSSTGVAGATSRVDAVDASLFFTPSTTAGPCAAPANGGTTTVGCRFVYDLMLNAGSNPDITAQQSALTFTSSILQNARVSSIGTTCALTNTVTPDFQTFDCLLRNEICNGPGNCDFRGTIYSPGFIGYAIGALANDPAGGTFRVARVGLCATAPGQAVLRWQWTPNGPGDDTEIVNNNGDLVQNPALFTDYVINVVPPPPSTPLIVGHVSWQGAPAQPDPRQQEPVTLTLRSGATEVDFPLQNTDSYGYFTDTLPTLSPGVYNWRIKGPKFLANGGSVTLTGSSITNLEAGLMKAGDANDDNVVNITDFSIMRNTFGKTLGQGGYDGRGDFNRDELVNVIDVALHKSNNGIAGAPPVGP
jgi:hypothetical protein